MGKEYRVHVVNTNVDKEVVYTIEAIGYSIDRIKDILNETHPEWNILEISSIEEVKEAI